MRWFSPSSSALRQGPNPRSSIRKTEWDWIHSCLWLDFIWCTYIHPRCKDTEVYLGLFGPGPRALSLLVHILWHRSLIYATTAHIARCHGSEQTEAYSVTRALWTNRHCRWFIVSCRTVILSLGFHGICWIYYIQYRDVLYIYLYTVAVVRSYVVLVVSCAL